MARMYEGGDPAAFGFTDIIYDKQGWVATVTINRPWAYNAYNAHTLQELAIAFRDASWDDRVAVVATGGLSHEPGGPRYLQVDEQFDRWFLDLLAEGDQRRIVRECTVERMEEAGSGGTAELLAWIAALPFTDGPAEVLGYAPSVAWRTGTGMVAWPARHRQGLSIRTRSARRPAG